MYSMQRRGLTVIFQAAGFVWYAVPGGMHVYTGCKDNMLRLAAQSGRCGRRCSSLSNGFPPLRPERLLHRSWEEHLGSLGLSTRSRCCRRRPAASSIACHLGAGGRGCRRCHGGRVGGDGSGDADGAARIVGGS